MTPPAEPDDDRVMSIRSHDFLQLVDQTLDVILDVVRRAGDDVANRTPGIPGANSLYALATHCLGAAGPRLLIAPVEGHPWRAPRGRLTRLPGIYRFSLSDYNDL